MASADSPSFVILTDDGILSTIVHNLSIESSSSPVAQEVTHASVPLRIAITFGVLVVAPLLN